MKLPFLPAPIKQRLILMSKIPLSTLMRVFGDDFINGEGWELLIRRDVGPDPELLINIDGQTVTYKEAYLHHMRIIKSQKRLSMDDFADATFEQFINSYPLPKENPYHLHNLFNESEFVSHLRRWSRDYIPSAPGEAFTLTQRGAVSTAIGNITVSVNPGQIVTVAVPTRQAENQTPTPEDADITNQKQLLIYIFETFVYSNVRPFLPHILFDYVSHYPDYSKIIMSLPYLPSQNLKDIALSALKELVDYNDISALPFGDYFCFCRSFFSIINSRREIPENIVTALQIIISRREVCEKIAEDPHASTYGMFSEIAEVFSQFIQGCLRETNLFTKLIPSIEHLCNFALILKVITYNSTDHIGSNDILTLIINNFGHFKRIIRNTDDLEKAIATFPNFEDSLRHKYNDLAQSLELSKPSTFVSKIRPTDFRYVLLTSNINDRLYSIQFKRWTNPLNNFIRNNKCVLQRISENMTREREKDIDQIKKFAMTMPKKVLRSGFCYNLSIPAPFAPPENPLACACYYRLNPLIKLFLNTLTDEVQVENLRNNHPNEFDYIAENLVAFNLNPETQDLFKKSLMISSLQKYINARNEHTDVSHPIPVRVKEFLNELTDEAQIENLRNNHPNEFDYIAENLVAFNLNPETQDLIQKLFMIDLLQKYWNARNEHTDEFYHIPFFMRHLCCHLSKTNKLAVTNIAICIAQEKESNIDEILSSSSSAAAASSSSSPVRKFYDTLTNGALGNAYKDCLNTYPIFQYKARLFDYINERQLENEFTGIRAISVFFSSTANNFNKARKIDLAKKVYNALGKEDEFIIPEEQLRDGRLGRILREIIDDESIDNISRNHREPIAGPST